jgi:hypothetical protein
MIANNTSFDLRSGSGKCYYQTSFVYIVEFLDSKNHNNIPGRSKRHRLHPKTHRKCGKNRAFTTVYSVNTVRFRFVIDRIIWRRNTHRIVNGPYSAVFPNFREKIR